MGTLAYYARGNTPLARQVRATLKRARDEANAAPTRDAKKVAKKKSRRKRRGK